MNGNKLIMKKKILFDMTAVADVLLILRKLKCAQYKVQLQSLRYRNFHLRHNIYCLCHRTFHFCKFKMWLVVITYALNAV